MNCPSDKKKTDLLLKERSRERDDTSLTSPSNPLDVSSFPILAKRFFLCDNLRLKKKEHVFLVPCFSTITSCDLQMIKWFVLSVVSWSVQNLTYKDGLENSYIGFLNLSRVLEWNSNGTFISSLKYKLFWLYMFY